jgi:hypothetical protein
VFGGKVALHAAVDLHVRRRPFRADGIVQRHAIGPGAVGKADIALPASRGKAMTGMPGWRAFSAAMIGRRGLRRNRGNPGPSGCPAQLSNSLTTSAPASIWAERYSTVASVIRSISAWKVARSASFSAWAAA